MIYTSYFAKINQLPTNAICISISRHAPKGYNGLEYKELAPSWEILRDYKVNNNRKEYTDEFLKKLKTMDPQKLINDLYALIGGNQDKDIVLVCYEKPENFCHRQIIAEWLTRNGYPVQEYPYP
jgi:uncharacterized protein YeaO (DUF488 family)